jgi:mRNA interferase RelE/StbE
MRYDIILSHDSVAELRRLEAHDRAAVRDALEIHLRYEPTKTSKSRIKRLRGMAQPQYRLRVGEVRVFYDVVGAEVHVLAVVAKSRAEQWLQKEGTPDEEDRSR